MSTKREIEQHEESKASSSEVLSKEESELVISDSTPVVSPGLEKEV